MIYWASWKASSKGWNPFKEQKTNSERDKYDFSFESSERNQPRLWRGTQVATFILWNVILKQNLPSCLLQWARYRPCTNPANHAEKPPKAPELLPNSDISTPAKTSIYLKDLMPHIRSFNFCRANAAPNQVSFKLPTELASAIKNLIIVPKGC